MAEEKRNEKKEKKEKKKKEKVVYIDDGSTVADMTPTDREGKKREKRERSYAPHAPLGDQFRTFREAQKMMLLPMCVMLGIIALAFLILYFLL